MGSDASVTGLGKSVCGPDVTRQIAAIWQKIQDDFNVWTPRHKKLASDRILTISFPPDIMSWDTLPLFQGNSGWLQDPRLTNCNCAVPVTPNDYEDAAGCSDTVQVGNQCWLNGSVNYGTYGIMVKLADPYFKGAQSRAETMINMYKAVNPFDSADIPLAWFRATYFGGPTGIPAIAGNRPNCARSCSLDGSIVNWDYVWEPIKPRDTRTADALYEKAKEPVLTMPAPVTPPPIMPIGPPVLTGPPAPRLYTVVPGDTLQKIAQKYYGTPTLWQKIYAANKSKVGANPDRLLVGVQLVIP